MRIFGFILTFLFTLSMSYGADLYARVYATARELRGGILALISGSQPLR